MKSKLFALGFCLLFAIPFLGAGIFVGVKPMVTMLLDWQSAKNWQPVPATILSSKLKSSRGKNSTTYRALATYRYQVGGRSYEASRIGLLDGDADNIGD